MTGHIWPLWLPVAVAAPGGRVGTRTSVVPGVPSAASVDPVDTMAEKYTSQMALLLSEPVEHAGEVVQAALAAGDIDREGAVRDGVDAREVNWGGRMSKGVVRRLVDTDGQALLRIESYVGSDGIKVGMQRQAQLLQALARQLRGKVTGVRDLSGMTDRDLGWVARVAIGSVQLADAIHVVDDGEGTHWVRTHGAARWDVPDLELYGLSRGQIEAARDVLPHVHAQLLDLGFKQDLTLVDGTPIYLVPVLEAWQQLPLDWPGVGRGGQNRGDGLDGPRATLSVQHRPRFGTYKKDFKGVLKTL